ncbi:MAG: hypothetical protein Kow0031_00140 [Anaerolineae bacterium]
MYSRKLTNTSLLVMTLVIVCGLFGLSTVFAASRTGHFNLLSPQIDVQATAQAIQVNNHRGALETDYQQRMALLQTQIDQVSQSLEALNRTIADQNSRQNSQLATLQQQVTAQQQVVDNLQNTATFLDTTMAREETAHRLQLVTLRTEFEYSEANLLAELEAASLQLAQAEAQLAVQRERFTATGNSSDGPESFSATDHRGGGGSNRSSDDSSSDGSDDHDDSHDDDSDKSESDDDHDD